MFTGIISDVGEVIEIAKQGERSRLALASAYDPGSVALGASIAISGVCLTVVEAAPRNSGARLTFDVGAETLAVTTLGSLHAGDKVNLERALRMGDELGGHIVSGHVDGLGEVLSATPEHGSTRWRFRVPKDIARFIAQKGSVCVDGVSLTVNEVRGDVFGVNIIPHTTSVTTFADMREG